MDSLIKYKKFYFNLADKSVKLGFDTKLKLKYKKLGLDKIFTTDINMWSNKMAPENFLEMHFFHPI